MKKLLKKILLIIFGLILNFNIFAEGENEIFTETAEEKPICRAFVLGDTKGNIYYSENENEMLPLASVTKVMTLILTYDAIDEGRIKLTDKVTIDKTMAEMGGSRIWMKEGTKISVEDLIKATALHSANNAAYGLAKAVGGDVDTFVAMMNKKAEDFGFGREIEYNTPTGLPPHMTGRGQDIGSALGVYKLSLAALKYPEYIKMAAQKEDVLSYSGKTKIYNRNKLLGREGIYGIKTGHLNNWYNIAVASNLENMNSIVVVLGAETEKIRDEKIVSEIKLFHKDYKVVEFLNKDIPVDEMAVSGGVVKIVEIYPDKNYEDIAKDTTDVKFVVYRRESVKAPINAGDEVGKYELYLNDKIVDKGSLVVRESIEGENSIFNIF